MSRLHIPKSFCTLANSLADRTKLKTEFFAQDDLLSNTGINKPLVFVLVDGMGECYLRELSSSSFLNSSKKQEMLSVFPSTTACAMMSLATGMPPAEHGVPGRYSYSKPNDIQINTLAFRDRFSGELLTHQMQVENLWPKKSFIAQSEIPAYTVIPQVLHKTLFEKYLCGNASTAGYTSVPDAVDKIIDKVNYHNSRAFYFLYLWELDSLAHEVGTKGEGIHDLLLLLDNELNRLREKTKTLADMVITADHGHINSGKTSIITAEHELMTYLKTAPYGEPRAAQLQVLPDRLDEFEAYFNESFGKAFTLFQFIPENNIDKAAALFGSDSLSANAAGNFGNYLAVAKAENLLIYTEGVPADAKINKGEHGGVLPDERLIPLIIPT